MMSVKSPFSVILSRHITEKSQVLERLHSAESNPCVRNCKAPKYVFIVHKKANKQEIARAVEEIYAERKIKVVSVNTINAKPKLRRMRGRQGMRPGFKKAIVTLEPGDLIEEKV